MHRSNTTTACAGSDSNRSSTSMEATTTLSNRSRLGIGGSNVLLAPSSLEQYASILQTALGNNISTFELSSIDDDSINGSGAQQAFLKALELARNNLRIRQDCATSNNIHTTISPSVITVLARFGYRTTKAKLSSTGTISPISMDGEGIEEETTVSDISTAKPFFSHDDILVSTTSNSSHEENSSNDSLTTDTTTTTAIPPNSTQISSSLYHNISPEYIHYCLSQSPLVQQKDHYNMNLIYMVHNPETQGGAAVVAGEGGRMTTTTPTNTSKDGIPSSEPFSSIRTAVRDRLKEAFIALERATTTNQISSYGVCSNGLSLPSTHPLHLSWKDIMDVAYEAAAAVHSTSSSTMTSNEQSIITPKLSAIQLPANLIEIQGFTVAQQIQEYVTSVNLPLDVFISRPLTCYRDQGVGTARSYPFKLLDYPIPVPTEESADSSTTPIGAGHRTTALPWTHELSEGRMQSQYLPAYNAAMGHFDAESILELQRERPLTVEERETVQGCRLLQQMLYDLDQSLQHTKSFHEYEDNLHTKVIPLIHNAFEELDETSTDLLQQFFMAHGAAVRVCFFFFFSL